MRSLACTPFHRDLPVLVTQRPMLDRVRGELVDREAYGFGGPGLQQNGRSLHHERVALVNGVREHLVGEERCKVDSDIRVAGNGGLHASERIEPPREMVGHLVGSVGGLRRPASDRLDHRKRVADAVLELGEKDLQSLRFRAGRPLL